MQATLAETPSTVAADGAPAPSARAAGAAGTGNAFVINLVSSTTPVALTRPDHAGLKRFTFFVSRRREDGRERFRLHMGYFDTQEEAEQLLDIVRTIYPGAWAGLAPGRRLGAGADVPGLPAAPGPAASPAIAAGAAANAAAAEAPVPAAAPRTLRSPARSAEVATLALVPDEGRRQLSDVTLDLEEPPKVERAAAGERPAQRDWPAGAARLATMKRPTDLERQAARRSLGNVRAAIASLADSAIRAPVLSAIPVLKPAIIPPAPPVVRQAPATAPATAAVSGTRAAEGAAQLSDSATLRLLESGSPEKRAAVAPEVPAARASPTAVPAQPAAARREAGRRAPVSPPQGPRAVPREEKPWYAVQLVWSVQPIAMTQVPLLAIFGAYTLYGAEGNRDGRRWYGLRLGFFTDAVSAKQVAHYVRADFSTVSVVPVTARERDQARQAVARAATGASASAASAAPRSVPAGAPGEVNTVSAAGVTVTAPGSVRGPAGAAPRAAQPEFNFIEGTEPPKKGARPNATPPSTGGRPAGALRPGGARPTRGAPGKRAKVRPPGQIHAHTRTQPKTLEETLEILGAGELRVEGDPSNEVRHLKLEANKSKPSKLSRLIERLSERMGN